METILCLEFRCVTLAPESGYQCPALTHMASEYSHYLVIYESGAFHHPNPISQLIAMSANAYSCEYTTELKEVIDLEEENCNCPLGKHIAVH